MQSHILAVSMMNEERGLMLDGLNDELVTTTPVRLVRLKEVMHSVGLGRSTIYRWMNVGRFPRPYPLGTHSIAWLESEIVDWIEERTGC